MPQITRFTSQKILTKQVFIDDSGTLQKRGGGVMSKGRFDTLDIENVEALRGVIQSLNPTQAIALGVNERGAGLITTAEHEKNSTNGAIARTAANFTAPNKSGFLFVDLDHHETNPYNSGWGAYDYLIQHVPQLAAAPALVITSSSSHIYNADGDDLTGFRGCHVYFQITDAADFTRATRALFDRLQLVGKDIGAVRYYIAENGNLLLRGRIDAAVGKPERLIFAGGAAVGKGLTQRREAHVFNELNAPLDTINALPDLTNDEHTELNKRREVARQLAAPDRLAHIEHLPITHQLAPAQRADFIAGYIQRLDSGYLPLDTVLHMQDGSKVTARAVLAEPSLYNGKRLADPCEPDTIPDKRIAIIQVNAGGVSIYSHAHGGQRWNLADICATVDIYKLPRVTLSTKTIDKQLAAAPDELNQAAIIWAYLSKHAKRAPLDVPPTLRLDYALQHAHHVTPDTAQAIKGRFIKWLEARKRAALAHISLTPAVLARHAVQKIDQLADFNLTDGYNGVYLIQAPMGAGKTQLIGAPFAAWARDNCHNHGRFAAISPRTSLTRELSERLCVTNYQDITDATAGAYIAAAICLPSISARRLAPIVKHARYLFIDEITQCLDFIESPDCKTADANNAGVYAALKRLVADAVCIIGADAGLDDRTVLFIEQCRPNERFNIVQMKPRAELTADFIIGKNTDARATGEICTRLMMGEKLWIACESKHKAAQLARTIETHFNDARVMVLTSDNKGDTAQLAFWENPETESLKYNAVIHSPVISSGLSIEHKAHGAHFDHVFYFGAGYVSTPADAAQMMRRVRYVKGATVVVGVNNGDSISDADNYLDGLEHAAALDTDAPTNAVASEFDSFCADVRTSRAHARGDFCAGLWWVLQAHGFTTTAHDDDGMGVGLGIARDALDAETLTAIMSAANIDDITAQILSTKDARTTSETHQLARHRIQKAFGISDLTPELIDFYDDGRGVRRLDRFLAARGWYAPHDDDATHLTRRGFGIARVRAYQILNSVKRLADGARFNADDVRALLDAAAPHRYALAFLHVIPAKFAADSMPDVTQPMRELAAIVEAMGGVCETVKNDGVRDSVLRFNHLDDYAALRIEAARMAMADGFAPNDTPKQPPQTRKQAARDALKAQAVAMAADGRTVREIADALGVGKSTVARWL